MKKTSQKSVFFYGFWFYGSQGRTVFCDVLT